MQHPADLESMLQLRMFHNLLVHNFGDARFIDKKTVFVRKR